MPAVNFNKGSAVKTAGQRGRRSSRSAKVPVAKFDDIMRARFILGFLLFVFGAFVIRAFYLQVIRYDYYSKAALNYQLKEYQIPAERGVILAKNGSRTVPLVLNEIKYTLFADPVYVKDPEGSAKALVGVVGGNENDIIAKLKSTETRYVILAKKLSREQHEKIKELELKGIGTREEVYRTYPQGNLAANTLGFVNDDGDGQYGVEQFMNKDLSGKEGQLKAITDAKGVPLVSNPDNVIDEPIPGKAVTLSIDIGMQKQVEEVLKTGLDRSSSKQGSLLVMNPNNGQIVAMASYPSYNPADISSVENLAALSNRNTSGSIEVGSIMKVLTAAAALDSGAVTSSTAFYNPGFVEVGDHKITDVFASEGTQSVESTLVDSLNTGAVWLLTQIGKGGINERARFTWYEYMTKHYGLGAMTGVEQAGEDAGLIPTPEDAGQGVNVIYANTSFGQALLATPVQMAAAFSSVLNGGTYYRPTVISSIKNDRGDDEAVKPRVVRSDVVNEQTSKDIIRLTESVVAHNMADLARSGYIVGGKTGTAEIARTEGGYYTDKYNGTYMGYVGGDKPEYVILVTTIEPKIKGYAGYRAAAPIFKDTVNMLLDNFGVTPKQ